MATLLLSLSPPPSFSFPSRNTTAKLAFSQPSKNHIRLLFGNRGGSAVVRRAGPSTNTYVLAAVLPLSLLAITVFASIRVSDRLDEKFLEEMATNEAIREAYEEEEPDEGSISSESEPLSTRTRNRPKREA